MTKIQSRVRPKGHAMSLYPTHARIAARAPASSPGLGRRSHAALCAALLASTALISAGPALAQALPTGGSVAAGSASIGAPTGNSLTVNQTSQSAVANWQSFSVGQGYSVNFVQPNASSAILNRVTGSTPSTIAGSITANGQVYLVNPNGIAITSTGTVNAAGFVASSLNISDADFMSGKRTFSGNGASASVSNAGTITIGRGGYAALLGGAVDNAGTITVPLGKVGLGAGEQATLDLSGDGFLQVAVPTNAAGTEALVRNSGRITANGGSVQLSADAARQMARQAINMSGTIEATSVGGRNGSIVLGGSQGEVKVSGKLTATAKRRTGGSIAVTGRKITLAGAQIDASGSAGGTVRIGGDRQGKGKLQRAETVSIDAASTIKADALSTGNGGDVVVWSDVSTDFAGQISARGGALSGNGGEAEVSGKAKLAYTGFTDLSAANGAFGTLLLDPYNVTISSGADSNQSGFTATGDDSVINATTLLTALSGANVNVSTGSGGGQAGTITVDAPLAWGAATTLTLNAASNIIIDSAITASNGGLTLASGGTISASAPVSIGGTFNLTAGNWVQNDGMLPSFDAKDFQITGGTFLRTLGGNGTSGTPYQLGDVYGLQGIATSTAYRAATWQLANDIDASGTENWNGGAGFAPIGNGTNGVMNAFAGTFDGQDHIITGLVINRPRTNGVGLFGYAYGSTIGNVGLVGGSMTGMSRVGGLVGENSGTITQAYTTGSVTGTFIVGGLVGANNTSIAQAYATGSVRGDNWVGGVVGQNFGTITQGYATGDVTGIYYVGGLAGFDLGTIAQAYASGSVAATQADYAGGLVGYKAGGADITASFWDSGTAGTPRGVGIGSTAGVTVLTTAQARQASSYTGWDFANDWYQSGDMRPIGRWEAAAMVNGVATITNMHQLALVGADLTGSYALGSDIDASATAGTNASGIWGTTGWVPIGDGVNKFSGTFDGRGHIIAELAINRPTTDYVGLFGFIGGGSTISNIGLVGGSVTGHDYVGGLVGQTSTGSSITQAYATGNVKGGLYAGGLVAVNVGTITQAYATGGVTGNNSVGGLAGLNFGSITQAYATGNATGGYNVGGLIGQHYGTASQTYATGAVTGTFSLGGLAGYSGGGISASFWDMDTTGQAAGVGDGSSSGLTGLTTAQARDASSYAGWDFANDWYQSGDMRPIGRWEAATAVNGVTTVTNLHQLALMGANLSGNYALSADIDASATAGTNEAGIWGTTGWVPIGSDASRFTGTFDGQGHVITGMTINRPTTDFVGLFGVTGTGSTIRNIGLVGVSVTGRNQVGGLVGYSSDSITQAYATGNVTGKDNVGGLVGINIGSITQAYATGSVMGEWNIGGLAGFSFGSITQAYATNSVTGDVRVGGLVGRSLGSISQAYSTGSVTGNTIVGGLVGQSDGTITQAYATGSVTAPSFVGGLVGYSSSGITASFWNTQTSGRNNGVGDGSSSGVTGLTTAQMADPFTFIDAGWDFASIWATPKAGGAPLLRSLTTDPVYAYYIRLSGDTSTTYGDTIGTSGIALDGVGTGNVSVGWGSAISAATNAGSYAYGDADVLAMTYSASVAGDYYLDYGTGTLSVAQRAITVTAGDQSRAYGDTAALDYTVGGSGLVNGDTLSGALAGIDSTTGVGTYALTQGTLTDANNANYAITYTGTNVDVTARAITVTADSSQSFTYGDTPVLDYTVGGAGLVNGDTLSGALAGITSTTGVGTYALTQGTITNADNSNYAITYTGANADVTARSITVTADSGQSFIYGDAPVLAYAIGGAGLVNGDTLAGALAGITSATGVGSYALTQGTLTNANYAITYNGANADVTARSITVTADAGQSFVYGNTPTLAYSVGGAGLVNGDTLVGALAGIDSMTGVGTYALTQGTLANANYAITYTGANADVMARAIIVTADSSQSFTYGVTPTLAYSVGGLGLVNGDTLAGALAGITSTTGVGTYALTQGTITDANNGNYAITYTGANADVTARWIAVSADNNQSFTYGDTPVLDYTVGGSGLVNGDTLAGALAGITSTTGVGTYALTQGTLTDANNGNYAITYDGADAEVTARAITVTADSSQSFMYGDTPTLAYAIGGAGLVNGDTLAGALAGITSATGVGSYALTQGTLTNANYAITYTGANADVTARAITVTADNNQSFIYGDTPTLAYSVGGSGLVNGDTLSGALAGITSATGVGSYALTQGTLTNANYAITYTGANADVTARSIAVSADNNQSFTYGDTPTLAYSVGGVGLVNGDTLAGALAGITSTTGVGTYALTQGTLSNANYAITYTGANADVTARSITVTADGITSVYGNAVPGLTYAVGGSGLVNGDSLTGALATAASSTSNIGSYAITQGSLTASSNYAVTYVGADAVITARPITLTATGVSSVYGDALPTLAYTVGGAGLANGDTLSGSLATTASNTSNVGNYAITQGSLAASSNYDVTYVGATATMTARPITLTATGTSFTYGDTPTLAYTVGGSGLVNGDALTGTLGGVGSASNVGTYTITQGSLAASSNYALTYVGADANVTARPLTVTAFGTSFTYGDVPALTYTVGGSGLVNGDALTGTLGGISNASGVGLHPITLGTLAASANYALTYAGADAVVLARPITVAASSTSRATGTANPTFTYVVSGRGLTNGDVLIGGLSSSATTTSPAGRYPIDIGTLSATANYVLSYVSGILTVTGGTAVDTSTLAALASETPGLGPSFAPVSPPPSSAMSASGETFLADPRFAGTVVCAGTACDVIQ